MFAFKVASDESFNDPSPPPPPPLEISAPFPRSLHIFEIKVPLETNRPPSRERDKELRESREELPEDEGDAYNDDEDADFVIDEA